MNTVEVNGRTIPSFVAANASFPQAPPSPAAASGPAPAPTASPAVYTPPDPATNPMAYGAGIAQDVNPTASQLSALAPQPYQNFGNIPTVSPTNVDTSMMPGALQGFENANATALAPIFQQQQDSLDANVGSRGIFNSGAATYLGNQLRGEQAGALAGADAPLIQGQQTAWNSANAQNATAGNTASALNAGFYDQAVTGNMNNANNYRGALYNSGTQYAGGILGGAVGTYGGPNSTALSTLGSGPTNALQAGQFAQTNSGLNPSGIASGVTSLTNAFTAPKSTTSPTPSPDPNPDPILEGLKQQQTDFGLTT
ncbi:MAG: hypothetical protein WCD38_11825 [Candidatus Tumulicola sp.]